MSDPATRLFEFDKVPTSPSVPPYVITSVTLRTLINKFLQERKQKASKKQDQPPRKEQITF